MIIRRVVVVLVENQYILCLHWIARQSALDAFSDNINGPSVRPDDVIEQLLRVDDDNVGRWSNTLLNTEAIDKRGLIALPQAAVLIDERGRDRNHRLQLVL